MWVRCSRRSGIASLLALSLLAATAGIARAEQLPDDETPPPPPAPTYVAPVPAYTYGYLPALEARPPTPWYGWQLMLCDVGSLAIAGVLRDNGGQVATLGFLAGPALIHMAHDRGRAARLSLVLRSALPFVGAMGGMLVGAYVDDHSSRDPDSEGSSYWIMGLLLGMAGGEVTALVLDYTVLSAADPAPARGQPRALGLAIAPRSGGLTLTLGGSF